MAIKGKTPPKGGAENGVGYGKPPQRTQFKRGKSGNPRGRPKGTKNLKTDLQEELAEKILVQEGDQARRMSKQRAVVKALVNRTLKGDTRAANSLLSTMMKLIDTGTAAEPEEPEELHADDLEILEAYRQRILRAASQDRRRRSRSNKKKGS